MKKKLLKKLREWIDKQSFLREKDANYFNRKSFDKDADYFHKRSKNFF